MLARQTAIGEELPTSVLEEIRHDELHTQRLKRAGVAPSRGRTGTALDNALAESVISTLKRELIARYRWPTRLDLELALVTYVGWYNSRRRHYSLKQRGQTRTRRLAPQQMLDLYNRQTAADSMLPRD